MVSALPVTAKVRSVALCSSDTPVHFACNVKSAVWPWVYGNETCVPVSSAAANQPAKVQPVLVGLVGAVLRVVAVVVVPEVTADPPLEL